MTYRLTVGCSALLSYGILVRVSIKRALTNWANVITSYNIQDLNLYTVLNLQRCLLLDTMITTGFEPAKRIACDLKSHSFDRTWIHYLWVLLTISLRKNFICCCLSKNTHGGARTHDNRIISTVLFQLSYASKCE